MTKQKTVMIQNPDGTESQYVPYADRLKQFLADFPIKEGWQRVAEPVPPGSIVTGFDEAYAKHLKECEELGIAPKRIVAYRAKLIDPQGRIVLQVHKIGIVDSWRDVMGAETRSLDRILVHAGYGSDPEEDVDADLHLVAQQMSFQVDLGSRPEAADTPSGQDSSGSIEVVGRPPRGRRKLTPVPPVQSASPVEDVPEPVQQDAQQVAAVAQPPPTPAPVEAHQTDPDEDIEPVAADSPVSSVPGPMLNTLHTMQASRKVPLTHPTTVDECRTAIRQLMNG